MGKIAGIRVQMHWTFLLLLVWVTMSHLAQGNSIWQAAGGLLFILAIFLCVVLHELGHALMARRYGIETRDILLLPIGGVSRLERMPRDPGQELRVAIVGPIVSLAIAALLFGAQLVVYGVPGDIKFEIVTGTFLIRLMWVNVMLAVFNLLPAFPMDGGRVLRAVLARRMNYVRATNIASYMGQGIAVLLVILGLNYNILLLLIGFFIFLGAKQEAYSVQIRSFFTDTPVREAMLTKFETLPSTASLNLAAQTLLASSQQDFPVEDGGRFVGLLSRKGLVEGLSKRDPELTVRAAMNKDAPTLEESERVEKAWEMLREQGIPAIPVTRNAAVVGLLTLENLLDFVRIRAARDENPAQGESSSKWRTLAGAARRHSAHGTR